MKRPEVPAPAGACGPVAANLIEPIVVLTPSLRADVALKKIHRELLRRIQENEEGVRQKLAGEYLHDFRVAVRRTRTGFRQLKHVYPPGPASRFNAEFSWLSDITGTARDLEVYLASLDGYRDALGTDSPEDLLPFLDFLRAHEDRERDHCTRGLDSERYRSLMRGWTDFLLHSPSATEEPADAGRPVRDVAAERITKAFARVAGSGVKIAQASPAAAFHRLRLDCKKLRYLLEFFAGLFDGDEGTSAVRALRRIQDSLGLINDLRVQTEWLQRFPGPATKTTRSLERYLDRRHTEERAAFLDVFAAFIDRDNQIAIERFLRSHAATQ